MGTGRDLGAVALVGILAWAATAGPPSWCTADPRLVEGGICEGWDTLGPYIPVYMALRGPVVNADSVCADIPYLPRSPEWNAECSRRYEEAITTLETAYLLERKPQILNLLTSFELYDTANPTRRLDSSDFAITRGYAFLAAKTGIQAMVAAGDTLIATYMLIVPSVPASVSHQTVGPMHVPGGGMPGMAEPPLFDLAGRRVACPGDARVGILVRLVVRGGRVVLRQGQGGAGDGP
jgi:hypothetical protein